MIKYSLLIALLLFILSPLSRADFNDGVVAYMMGDYELAFKQMQSLSELSEHSYAQYYLGIMYMRGQGVEQNFKEASKWFRKAAEQNIPQAQYKLGDLYFKGRGVPLDYEFAYVWFSVGAAHKHQLSQTAINKAKEKLSAEELAEAEKLIASYVRKYGPKEDIDRRQPIRIDSE